MITTIYEDSYLLVVDKPSGLLTVPTPKKETSTLTDILNREAKEKGQNSRVYPCHRLDRETSGLIIYAKSKKIRQMMMDQFRARQVKKDYIALVSGKLEKTSGRIKSYISDHPAQAKKLAVTDYMLIRQFSGFAEVLVMPLTGRTNQIRIQFKQIGHPLLGESRFAFRRDFKVKARRLALHAACLKFNHPISRSALCFHSTLPGDLEGLLK